MNESPPQLPEALDIPPERLRARRAHLLAELDASVPPVRKKRGRPPLVLALGALLAASTAAGAATGVLPVGSGLGMPALTGEAEPRYRSQRVVVATGSAPKAGRWEMTYAETDNGSCLGLRLLDVVIPGARGPELSEGCGVAASFTVGTVGGGDGRTRSEYLVHGRAPEDAESVRLVAEGGVVISAKTHEGPSDVPGDLYLLATPPGLRNASLSWFGAETGARGPDLIVPGTTDYGPPPEGTDRPR